MSLNTIPWRYVKNVMQNGVGRHVCQLQRLTISFCKEHNSSRGTRYSPHDIKIHLSKIMAEPSKFGAIRNSG